jgi:hypothetical protein
VLILKCFVDGMFLFDMASAMVPLRFSGLNIVRLETRRSRHTKGAAFRATKVGHRHPRTRGDRLSSEQSQGARVFNRCFVNRFGDQALAQMSGKRILLGVTPDRGSNEARYGPAIPIKAKKRQMPVISARRQSTRALPAGRLREMQPVPTLRGMVL